MIQEFRRSLLTVAQEDKGGAQAVYQINFQAFPLTAFLTPEKDESEAA
ncbi:MAG: hypothetical protein KF799_00275 [Bdellovibrionales bacterium]|nr:hypothetical protein [Bdellovibrionales bacterium]